MRDYASYDGRGAVTTFMGYESMWICMWVAKFRSSLLPPFSWYSKKSWVNLTVQTADWPNMLAIIHRSKQYHPAEDQNI